ncbi:hypothetical protein TREMEDRAFT_67902 [Tremella mesenterica DSM 1558]|uniref:uncharacterized protein n=1 Tax=Tremella mesenterica (strain ATCC 24925 / CBS 8224 / DSM 1558 / NBRC 9311 / NRRL Y-6157 / RJB 2259-6 / UBC 559-6) TaxID=578456 RepID=UPI0003F494AB|nr:uncharacterized protein TREMEDRAFT_67902 [Tremella mesenterica DSM 1558]EIW71680.1 hypothetical protein TREMEDRAFT_67902 [Tremella mesenterica DSM 1558]
MNVLHWVFGFGLIYSTCLALVTPHTAGWKMFRITITPFISIGWLWCAFGVHQINDDDLWGTAILMTYFALPRTLELLVFFPPEENVFRLRTSKPTIKSMNGKGHNGIEHHDLGEGKESEKVKGHEDEVLPEPIPAPFTLAKFYWASSLWWSLRGVGWNYCCPLPHSSRIHPYTRSSSRRSYLLARLQFYLIWWLLFDVLRSFMNLSSASAYFSGRPGVAPLYSDLSQWERGVYSACVALRIIFGCEKSHCLVSSVFVLIGGMMGWEGEIWSPWGWPPLFGTLGEVWRSSGLSNTWSRTWQGYFRRWLWIFGVKLISEDILHLPHSGPSPHSHFMSQSSIPPTTSETSSPAQSSGRSTPYHPLPTAKPLAPRRLSTKMVLANLLKSIIVFSLSGLIHDVGTYILLFTERNSNPHWREVLVLTPFFAIQPLGLVVEAVIKTLYRGVKRRWFLKSNIGMESPQWLTFLERLVGFVWTWVWIGWTAGWFVDGLTKAGMWRRGDGRVERPSLVGGLVWGKWMH